MEKSVSRRSLLKTFGAGAAVLSLSGLLEACGAASGGKAAVDQVSWALTGSAPQALDVAVSYTLSCLEVLALCQETLVTVDSETKLQPQLAASWEQPDDHHFVYHLRTDVKFADGSPMTADDVVFSLQRHRDPKVASQIATFFENVAKIEATGADQVTVTLSQPDELFRYVPTFVFIMPRKYAEQLGAKYGAPGNSVSVLGTGPYRVTKFVGNSATVEVNDHYWKKSAAPTVKRAKFDWITNPQTIYLAMQAGSIDGVFNFRPGQYRAFDTLPTAATTYGPAVTTFYWCFNVEAPPWNDVHVRRAIAHATDRAGYVKAYLAGHGEAARAIPTPASWSSIASPDEVQRIYAGLRDYPYDLAKAKAELAQSAHPQGFTADISFPDIAPDLGQSLVSLASALKTIGIELRVREQDTTAWAAAQLAHKDLGMNVKGPNPSFMDPSDVITQILASGNAVKNGLNLANYRNPEVDDLLRRQNSTADNAGRREMLARILSIVAEDVPYFPVYSLGTPMALSKKLAYAGFNPLFNLQNWLGSMTAA
ncbi:ABC transporter substrate-binding protein [Amycolatopsis jejuensis]|uniref:ABC transporter substrate-binding protein n=1 Tax=Amycolatopsis jejuensis TaxID=330084 RepID=UPI000526C0E1|nr:ABC transporter substrate-binding protein [Amycolatopsis jejuensis]